MQEFDFGGAIKALDLTEHAMRFVGTWPPKNFQPIFLFFLIYLIVHCTLAIIEIAVNITNMGYVISCLMENVFNVVALLKISICKIKRKSLAKFIDDIRSDFTLTNYYYDEEKMAFINYNKFSRKFVIVLLIASFVASSILSELLEEDFNLVILLQLIGSILQFCIVGYDALVRSADGNTTMLLSFLFIGSAVACVLLVYCYIGECLIKESSVLSDALYLCEWYNISKEEKKLMHICMLRSTKEMRLTSGKFFVLSLTTFTDQLFGVGHLYRDTEAIIIILNIIHNKIDKLCIPCRLK
ncbi:hypothetical protein HZH66_013684 [Vespula vulgaris]|uniref:Odorant receptor n=1 Tax=Vespula vulgaris TaxID=7454 RepID=A0A834J681_VESVU|nr:hypothetical protein HZH66_013684 [Vespula vulgaris]